MLNAILTVLACDPEEVLFVKCTRPSVVVCHAF